jgi:mRNA interferase RelE/StbE
MNWTVEYTKTFLKELARLPKEIRSKAETIAFEEIHCDDPFLLGYVERM